MSPHFPERSGAKVPPQSSTHEEHRAKPNPEPRGGAEAAATERPPGSAGSASNCPRRSLGSPDRPKTLLSGRSAFALTAAYVLESRLALPRRSASSRFSGRARIQTKILHAPGAFGRSRAEASRTNTASTYASRVGLDQVRNPATLSYIYRMGCFPGFSGGFARWGGENTLCRPRRNRVRFRAFRPSSPCAGPRPRRSRPLSSRSTWA